MRKVRRLTSIGFSFLSFSAGLTSRATECPISSSIFCSSIDTGAHTTTVHLSNHFGALLNQQSL